MRLKTRLSWRWCSVLLLLWFFAGALLFCTSMLSASTLMPQTASEVCTGLTPVDQVVIILIDAMRPDFSLSRLRAFAQRGGDCSGGDAVADSYHLPTGHTLTYIENSLRDADKLSQGYFLVADAPTTTAQRIKAIATGTMPAFLEAGSNFNSEATELDSFVRQAQGRAIILGDDTWTKLFPKHPSTAEAAVPVTNRSRDATAPQADAAQAAAPHAHWKRTVDIPSFDVADFHTNDDAVLANLYTILEQETKERVSATPSGPSSTPAEQHAKVVIGHFLGVDHIGHRLSADNPTMHAKLSQLDAMLANVTSLLRSRPTHMRTMLLVLGDHGMTNSGDHGGESVQETDTFLYAEFFGGQAHEQASDRAKRQHADALSASRWRRKDDPALHRLQSCQRASGVTERKLGAAYQVDVTSTIAVLMGRPIPFSNFGRVLPEVLALADAGVNLDRVERCNYQQFSTYAQAAGMPMPPAASVTAHGGVEGGPEATHEARQRQALARFSFYARKTRSVMNRNGMFAGAWMLLVAAFSLLWISDVQLCFRPGDVVANWTLVVVMGRLITVFSNSFVTNEDTELLTLLSSLLWISATSSRWWRAEGGKARWWVTAFSVCGFLVFRHAAPYAYRHRFPITHAVASMSHAEQWAAHWAVPERVGLYLGGAVAAVLYGHRCSAAVVVMAATVLVLSFFYKVPRWHHLVPVLLSVGYTGAFSWYARRHRRVRAATTRPWRLWSPALYWYVVWVLWCSLLCNEGVVAAAVIAVYGCALPFFVRAMRRVSTDTSVAVQLHLLSYIVFFLEGHQCMLSTIDWNASFVGMTSYSLVGGGVLVISRTFNAFLVVPVACALQNQLPDVGESEATEAQEGTAHESCEDGSCQRDARPLCHYVLHVMVLQAAVSCFNGYIQKSHLMLYPIFCPKYLFDVVIALVTGAGVLLSMIFV